MLNILLSCLKMDDSKPLADMPPGVKPYTVYRINRLPQEKQIELYLHFATAKLELGRVIQGLELLGYLQRKYEKNQAVQQAYENAFKKLPGYLQKTPPDDTIIVEDDKYSLIECANQFIAIGFLERDIRLFLHGFTLFKDLKSSFPLDELVDTEWRKALMAASDLGRPKDHHYHQEAVKRLQSFYDEYISSTEDFRE